MSNHKEKRKYMRMRKPAIVRFQKKTPENPLTNPDEWDTGAVLNIGAGGLLFYHNKKLDIDSFLDLKIYLHNPETLIDCVGKVTRVEEIPHMFLIAALYTEIAEADKNMLKNMAKDFHPEPLND